MSNFQIFVDSTSDMFTELRKEYDVDYVADSFDELYLVLEKWSAIGENV